jgi:hypothetical protein
MSLSELATEISMSQNANRVPQWRIVTVFGQSGANRRIAAGGVKKRADLSTIMQRLQQTQPKYSYR